MNADRPLVSVVTPSLDQGRYLARAIESVQAQTYPAVEHIVVDGGSSDSTLEILDGQNGLRWVSEPDRGQAHALNKGFAMAKGAILGWLNSDDYYLPEAVAEGVAALQSTGAGVVYADVTRVNDDDVNPRRIRSRSTFDLWTEANLGCGIFSPSVFFTREAFEAVGGLDERYHFSLDYDLWLRIGKGFPLRHVDAVWAVQRVHDEAKSVSQSDRFWPERLEISRRHGGRLVSPLLIRRIAGTGAAATLLNRAAGAVYMLKERRYRAFADRVRGSLEGR